MENHGTDPSTRGKLMNERIRAMIEIWTNDEAEFHGHYVDFDPIAAWPKPVQKPYPPFFIGGGGRRLLTLAAREADIVGVHCNLRRGELDRDAAADLADERVEEKVGWVREAAQAAGRQDDGLELQFSTYLCRVTDAPRSARASVSTFAEHLAADPDLLERSPAVLVGSVDHCVETLRERRARFGLSYLNLGGDVENVAPVVARLAGS
jgi:alkanesulfonate monooxygenase SsuD/methylene tetrahydromethanopterin reductase-like flavin-dependent oxidoreductase (luciferase family)